MPRASDADAIAATESWFVRRGLPHFIFHYRASRNVWTRAAPVLTLIALIEVVGNAPNADFPVWVSVLASVAAFVAVIAVWAVANRLRHRPLFARPVDVGPVEVALFVIVPALVPMASGGQVRSGLVTGAANVALLYLICITTSYGIAPMTRWALGHGARQIRSVSDLIVRALPLLLLVVIVVFYTVEPFQIAHTLPWPLIGLAIGLFFLVGLLFAVIRVPRQVDDLSEHESWATLRERATETPAAPLLKTVPTRAPKVPRLSRKEWLNVGLVVLASEGCRRGRGPTRTPLREATSLDDGGHRRRQYDGDGLFLAAATQAGGTSGPTRNVPLPAIRRGPSRGADYPVPNVTAVAVPLASPFFSRARRPMCPAR